MNLLLFVVILCGLELVIMVLVKSLRRRFQWLITSSDEVPALDSQGLAKFIPHGYDPELGWIRKPNTWHPERGKCGTTSYHIDAAGSRCNPGHEDGEPLITIFGDSFSFCRQVNDDETWQWQLSELTKGGVLNFAVGNYGIDQAYLRMEREIKNNNVKGRIVILGVVPSTIVRILCVWKHYNEFGNTFGFKPRFDLKGNELILLKNSIDDESKFAHYQDYIEEIKKNDYFYMGKFRDEMIRFPYLYHTLRHPMRNFSLMGALLASGLLEILRIKNKRLARYPLMRIMHINKILRYRLFQEQYATDIFLKIIDKYVTLTKKYGLTPVFLFMPQKDDVLFIRERGPYYDHCIAQVRSKLPTVDMTDYLLNVDNLDELYSDDNVYGGHFSKQGNRFVAEKIVQVLKENALLPRGE